MARRYYQLPSLTALNTFESCARQTSFTLASSELGVTLGAVSRQIKQLEAELGCQLFIRNQRGVALTSAGMELQNSLTVGFANIANACRSIRLKGHQSNITIAATTAFASLWLIPRLGGFWTTHPDINVNHGISDNINDIVYSQSDIRIRYGDGHWPGETSILLFSDIIYPVCGAEFDIDDINQPEQLLAYPLIQLDGRDPQWSTWQDWMAYLGIEDFKANYRHFTNYLIALQAAQQNQGISLGWHSLVGPLIEAGKLKRVGNQEIPAPYSFYLTWDKNTELSEDAEKLKQWLIRSTEV